MNGLSLGAYKGIKRNIYKKRKLELCKLRVLIFMHDSILMACIIQCRTLVIYQDTNIKLLKMNDFAKIFLSSMLNVLVYFLFNIIDVERDTHISYFINYLIDRPYSEETDSNLVISFTQSSCFSKF